MNQIPMHSEFVVLNNLLSCNISRVISSSLKHHRISFDEFIVLLHLSEMPNVPLGRTDLALLIGKSSSSGMRVVARLEDRGLIQSVEYPSNRRLKLVEISVIGKRIYNEALPTFSQSSNMAIGSLESDDLKSLVELYRKQHAMGSSL